MAEETPLLAGKFKDEASLAQGIREGLKVTMKVPLPESVKIIGDGGIYASVDDAVSGYKEIESKIGKLTAPTPPTPPKGDDKPLSLAPPPPPPDVEYDDPADAAKAAGLNMADLESQWAKDGKLTDEQYAKLKSVKITKAAANAWASGIAAQRQASATSYSAVVTSLGGKEAIEQLIASVKDKIPASQVDTLDAMLKDPKTLPVAVQALKSYAGSGNGGMLTGSGMSSAAKPKNADEQNRIIARALAGDPAAMELARTFDTSNLSDGLSVVRRGK